LDGEHAIDLTLRGQKAPLFRDGTGIAILHPADEYFGVEIPTTDVLDFMRRRKWSGSILADWSDEPA
jgi:hypothetical protein